MEDYKEQQKPILGVWWQAIRVWFYPLWLIYETSIRFYDYSLGVHSYFIEQQYFIGETFSKILAITCGLATFLICTFYLTLPASFSLYKFFKGELPISNPLIHKIKSYF